MLRVSIPTVAVGSGHLQAAVALEEAWKQLHPEDTIERIDVLTFAGALYRKMYAELYVKLVEHAPELYSLFFNRTDNPVLVRKLTRLRRLLARGANTHFARHLRTTRPQVVLCPHFLPLEILGSVKGRLPHAAQPFTVSVITDFEAHALWMEPCVDLYAVAAEETRGRLVARGVAKSQVMATGIPISRRFSRKLQPREIRKGMGLRDDLPILLVLGGGLGLGPMDRVLQELQKVPLPIQILAVCGRNEALRARLAVQDWTHPTRVAGFVANMEEWMAISDLVLTKPGGLTSSEALALGKPLFILEPIPGQESANSDFLLEHGAAVKVNRPEDIPFRIESLLEKGRLQELSRSARGIGKPAAALEICREIRRRLGERTA